MAACLSLQISISYFTLIKQNMTGTLFIHALTRTKSDDGFVIVSNLKRNNI